MYLEDFIYNDKDTYRNNFDRWYCANSMERECYKEPKLSEEKAKEVYSEENIKVFKCKFTPMSNTFKDKKSKCMLKIVVNKLTDKVLGCHMFGETSSEIIQMVSISLNAGITKKDFDITMALHPTISEEFVTMYG